MELGIFEIRTYVTCLPRKLCCRYPIARAYRLNVAQVLRVEKSVSE